MLVLKPMNVILLGEAHEEPQCRKTIMKYRKCNSRPLWPHEFAHKIHHRDLRPAVSYNYYANEYSSIR